VQVVVEPFVAQQSERANPVHAGRVPQREHEWEEIGDMILVTVRNRHEIEGGPIEP
jgi:hypothetical protein